MINLHLECDSCQAVFNLKHDNNKEYYKLVCCPFCGEPMDDYQQDEVHDNDE